LVLDQRRNTVNSVTEKLDFVIGVDTHKQTHTVAVLDRTGSVRTQWTVSTILALCGGW
jgi:hypothetical protein